MSPVSKEGETLAARGTAYNRRPVWVNGRRFDTLKEAAEWLSEILNRKVWASEICYAIRADKQRRGYTARYAEAGDDKPSPEKSEPVPVRTDDKTALLRYPRNEAPLSRGLPERWR
jgi:hypothetical protein